MDPTYLKSVSGVSRPATRSLRGDEGDMIAEGHEECLGVRIAPGRTPEEIFGPGGFRLSKHDLCLRTVAGGASSWKDSSEAEDSVENISATFDANSRQSRTNKLYSINKTV